MRTRVVSSAITLFVSAGALAQTEGNSSEYPVFNCFPPAVLPTRPNIVVREGGLTGRPSGWNEPKISRVLSESANIVRSTVPAAADEVAANLFAQLQTQWDTAPHYSVSSIGIDLQNLCGGIDIDVTDPGRHQVAPPNTVRREQADAGDGWTPRLRPDYQALEVAPSPRFPCVRARIV